jgi:DNA-binding transcriptional regulator LsrR (DeoR family)
VESEAVRLALLQERNIRETMELAAQAHVALVGIGSVVPQVSSLIRAGYLTEGQLSEVAAHGAVGDICARHFDSHGRILDLPINRRIVGIDISVLHRIPWVVGVAGGLAKAPAILGALRGRHVNVLITDDAAAREVLHLEEMAAAEPSLTQA